MKGLMKGMLAFLKSLFDVTSNTDEKIVVGFLSYIMLVFMTLVDQFTIYKLNNEAMFVFVGILFACFSLGTYAGIRGVAAKTTVATEIVKADASSDATEAAQQVIQAEKPQS